MSKNFWLPTWPLSSTAAPDVPRTLNAPQPVAEVAAFTEVLVSASAEARFTTPSAQLELVLANPRRIVITAGFNPATLTAVLDLLEQRPC
jgi:hypothetical protein